MATRGGAQVARKPSLILRPGNNQCIKNLNREGGHFWIVARGHFSVGITTQAGKPVLPIDCEVVLQGYGNIFEGRITRDYRFFFLIETDTYTLLRCGRHEEYLK